MTGLGVETTSPYLLADDFLCEEPGRITDITIWGSWYYDQAAPPETVWFTLSIHEHSPVGPGGPGEILWIRDFYYPDYVVEVYAVGLPHGWLEPPWTWGPYSASNCWIYRFTIPPEEAFHQVGMPGEPLTYWLDVQAHVEEPGPLFGWRTSVNHWSDAAVWGEGTEPFSGPWGELTYPPDHPFFPDWIDLAFGLNMTYGTDVPEEAEVVPERAGLYQNVPNPFNPTTTIAYDVPAGVEGRRSVTWRGVDDRGAELPSGVYFYRMNAGDYVETRKMLLLK